MYFDSTHTFFVVLSQVLLPHLLLLEAITSIIFFSQLASDLHVLRAVCLDVLNFQQNQHVNIFIDYKNGKDSAFGIFELTNHTIQIFELISHTISKEQIRRCELCK
jgi:hypothetical protein